LSDLQKRYLKILEEKEIAWVKTIAMTLNVDERVVEKDIEPLLINLWIIEKTTRWRKLLKKVL
jgi:Holliday junction resolvasome RuvABC ATP-dependent DNA helicase subunit